MFDCSGNFAIEDEYDMAAGGFVSRAFETMLKESGGKKFPDLQKAIQAYQGQISFFKKKRKLIIC